MNGLYEDSSSLRTELKEWERNALEKFELKMKDKLRPFPCIPATIGFSTNQLRYGFVSEPRSESAALEVAKLLRAYTEKSRQFGNYTSLIVFYETPQELINFYTVEQFEQLFWEQLNRLSELDEMDWPANIPIDPHEPIWEFCFHGEQYFMYCGTPSHQNRRSRHSDYFMLAITPRWVLREFNKSEAYAKNIKNQVRKRLEQYDTIEIHPDLNSYGKVDNFEWKQYYLRDDESSLSKCPFHKMIENIDSN